MEHNKHHNLHSNYVFATNEINLHKFSIQTSIKLPQIQQPHRTKARFKGAAVSDVNQERQ